MNYLHQSYFGNEILNYLMAAGLLAGGMFGVWLFSHVLLRRLEHWASATKTRLDDFIVSSIQKAIPPLLYYGVFYLSIKSLILNPSLSKGLLVFGTALITFIAIRFVLQMIRFGLFDLWLAKRPDARQVERQFKSVMPILTILVWALGIVFLLDNLGFEISTLVAGLGIGGIAVALASQTILADMFSYLSITLDRPFELDDYIITNDFQGTVEHIGIKTTRIRSLSGEELIFSNKDLTDSRLRNYKRMQMRRVEFSVGLTYDHTSAQLKRAVDIIRGIISKIPNTRLERVHFSAFDEYKLTLQAAYHVLSAEYNVYMDIQQTINLEVKDAFEKEGFAFADRTQRIQMKNLRATEADCPPPIEKALH